MIIIEMAANAATFVPMLHAKSCKGVRGVRQRNRRIEVCINF